MGLRKAAEELSHRHFLVVALILDAEEDFPVNWIYIHEPDVQVVRVQNFGDCVERIRKHLDGKHNLHPVGRNGNHKYNNQDHSMHPSMRTVWNIEGAANDIGAVNTGFEYLEEEGQPVASVPEDPDLSHRSVGSGCDGEDPAAAKATG